ncbi:MAG: metal ABC transporter permease [Phycisphaerales bacterium]|nr:metal ABC transporter permease [Phycisphaerales bacterium]
MIATGDIVDVLLLREYNTALVVLSTAMLGFAAGCAGTLLLLRKRALLGDVVSHATFPGVVGAFIVMQAMGLDGKHLPGLLVGATASGLAAAWATSALRKATGLKNDAIMGIVLGASFGAGVAMMAIAQGLPGGNQAGLESFIYGKTASMVRDDAIMIGIGTLGVITISTLLCKEFRLLCFDEAFGCSIGRPMTLFDGVLMFVAVAVIVLGLQAVGLILIIALLIIPASAARFWTDRFTWTMCSAGVIGAASGWIGSTISALEAKLPAGAVIVLVCATCFMVSMLAGTRHGLIRRWWRQWRLSRRVLRQHLLRAMHERSPEGTLGVDTLVSMRSWTPGEVRTALRRALGSGDVTQMPDGWRLTEQGRTSGEQIVRNHRLWELFLIHHADIAPSHVDRDADLVEHVLDSQLVARLESLLDASAETPESPHPLEGGAS